MCSKQNKRLKFECFSSITRCDVNVNVNLMVENVTRIKSGIIINVFVSTKIQKNKMHSKRIIFGILLHVLVKMLNIYQLLLTIQSLHMIKL